MMKKLKAQLALTLATIAATSMARPQDASTGYGANVYKLPPKEPDFDTMRDSYQFSEVYQREVPKELIEAGIETVDRATGEALLGMYGTMQFAQSMKVSADGYCGLDFQDRMASIAESLGKHVEAVDVGQLEKTLGSGNPLVKLAQDATKRFQSTVGRTSNFERLLDQYAGDTNAVMSRYYG